MPADQTPPVVTVTPTILDGTVVRWYLTAAAADRGHEAVSASRNGIIVKAYLNEVPPEVIAQAEEAYEILRDNGPRELVQDMATHRRKLGRDGLEPIQREENADA